VRDFIEKKGELTLAMLVGGALAIPIFGWLPLIAIGAAIATSVYIDKSTRPK